LTYQSGQAVFLQRTTVAVSMANCQIWQKCGGSGGAGNIAGVRDFLILFVHLIVCGSRKPPIALIDWELSLIVQLPFGHIFTALIASLSTYFRSRAALQLEILALRH
jgi:hypothetical protein